jgi:hypothetical protein
MSCNTGFHHRCDGCSCTCHTAPIPATNHVASIQDSLREFGLSEDDVQVFGFPFFGK